MFIDATASSLVEANSVVTITPNSETHNVPFLASNMPISAEPALAGARVRETDRYQPIANYEVSGADILLAGAPH